MRLRTHPGFRLFWTASTVSGFGSQVTTLAVQVLVVTTLAGSAADVGLVNAARWVPYLLFGVIAGALADRVRRKPLLVGSDLARAVLLCAVPLLAWGGALSVPVLVLLMAIFGLASLINDAAHQSFLPRLVPRESLTWANARLQQSSAAADTSGPAVAGGLVAWLGAPVAVLVDAVSYLVSGVLTAQIAASDPPAPARGPLPREIREGLAWVYGHRMLRPLSLCSHGWVVFAAMLGAVYVPYGLLRLGFSSLGLGLTLACAGVGGLLGSGLSERLGRAGLAIPLAWLLQAVGIAILAVTPVAGWSSPAPATASTGSGSGCPARWSSRTGRGSRRTGCRRG
jgi:MFS family permease